MGTCALCVCVSVSNWKRQWTANDNFSFYFCFAVVALVVIVVDLAALVVPFSFSKRRLLALDVDGSCRRLCSLVSFAVRLYIVCMCVCVCLFCVCHGMLLCCFFQPPNPNRSNRGCSQFENLVYPLNTSTILAGSKKGPDVDLLLAFHHRRTGQSSCTTGTALHTHTHTPNCIYTKPKCVVITVQH